jgi:hypothetical protein
MWKWMNKLRRVKIVEKKIIFILFLSSWFACQYYWLDFFSFFAHNDKVFCCCCWVCEKLLKIIISGMVKLNIDAYLNSSSRQKTIVAMNKNKFCSNSNSSGDEIFKRFKWRIQIYSCIKEQFRRTITWNKVSSLRNRRR